MRGREAIALGRETQECLWHKEQGYVVGAESLCKNTGGGGEGRERPFISLRKI